MIITPGEEGKAFDALAEAIVDLPLDLYERTLDVLAGLRERFEQISNDRACATRSASEEMDERMRLDKLCAEQRERIERLEERVAGLEEERDEAREDLHQFCVVALKCGSMAVNIDEDIDDALGAVRSAIAFEEEWTEPLAKAGIKETNDLVKLDPDGAKFLDELGAQLQTKDPIHGLKLKLGRSAPGEPAIIPNAWHMSPAQLAYELANL